MILVEFRMRYGFRARVVTGLKDRGYQGKKDGGSEYWHGRPREEAWQPQDVHKPSPKGEDGNRYIGTEEMKRLGTGRRVSRW